MRIPLRLIPAEIIKQYNLNELVEPDGFMYIEIRKGMYGLPQAGIIAHNQLKEHLAPFGYAPCRHTPGLWKHSTRNIMFCLVVDDFGIKYVNKDDAYHLFDALGLKYTSSVDWEGKLFCGLTLTWDYQQCTCDLSMPGCIEKALHKFQHPNPARSQDDPHPCD